MKYEPVQLLLNFVGFAFLSVSLGGCSKFETYLNSTSSNTALSSFKTTDFFDTGSGNSLQTQDDLFQFYREKARLILKTESTETNIHSHLNVSPGYQSMIYSGSMMVSDARAGIGITFLSQYPFTDAYYRVRRYQNNSVFHIENHGNTACSKKYLDINPEPMTWYRFKVTTAVFSSKTDFTVSIWKHGTSEDQASTIFCSDSSQERFQQGTIGVWSMGPGVKYWSDFSISYNPFEDISVDETVLSDSEPLPMVEQEITLVKVTASSHDGHLPEYAIDRDVDTRWSANGIGEFLDITFDAHYQVSRVEVIYASDVNQTESYFDAYLQAGVELVQILKGESAAHDANVTNSYDISDSFDSTGLKIVGLGNNTSHNWNSIAEVRVFGYKVDSTEPVLSPGSLNNSITKCVEGEKITRVRYESETVPYGSSCQSQQQVQECVSGKYGNFFPNEYTALSCSVEPEPPVVNNEPIDCQQLECFYVRSGAAGNNTGMDWENAYSSLPDSLVRGAVYFIAQGNYGSYNFNDTQSGSQWIQLRKALSSDHGTDVGWNDTYSIDPARFTQWTFSTGFYKIDGQTGGGEGSWKSGYGIEVSLTPEQKCTGNDAFIAIKNGASDLEIRHTQMFATSNNYKIRGINATTEGGGSTNIIFAYNAIHTIFGQALYMNNWSNSVFEHNYIADVRSTGANDAYCTNIHGEGVATIGKNRNITFRYNLWDNIKGTAVFAGINVGESVDWKIYGNIFSRSTTTIYYYNNVGSGGTNSQFMTNLSFYNNIIVNMPGSSQGGLVLPGSGNRVMNNIWFNNIANSFGISGSHDYNLFVKNRRVSGCPDGGCPKDGEAAQLEIHGQTLSSSPFVNASSDPLVSDYRLKIATDPGLVLKAPFDKDMSGVTRGADGHFDRGAFEK